MCCRPAVSSFPAEMPAGKIVHSVNHVIFKLHILTGLLVYRVLFRSCSFKQCLLCCRFLDIVFMSALSFWTVLITGYRRQVHLYLAADNVCFSALNSQCDPRLLLCQTLPSEALELHNVPLRDTTHSLPCRVFRLMPVFQLMSTLI